MPKICPFMSRPYKRGDYPEAKSYGEVPCYEDKCQAWFHGWKDVKDSGYCKLIDHPDWSD